MKVSGAEFREWFENHFPAGFYMDGDYEGSLPMEDDSGKWALAPDELVDPDDYGGLYWDGRDCAPGVPDPTRGDGMSLSTAIKRWRKARDFDVVTLRVSKSRAEDLRAFITGFGAEILP